MRGSRKFVRGGNLTVFSWWGERGSQYHDRPTIETPLNWCLNGGPMTAQHWMLAWSLCDLPVGAGVYTSIPKTNCGFGNQIKGVGGLKPSSHKILFTQLRICLIITRNCPNMRTVSMCKIVNLTMTKRNLHFKSYYRLMQVKGSILQYFRPP